MEYLKQNFTILDLENFSGVKAHTIRIWEQRYSILVPERTDTNIRVYDIVHLQKILNISYLNNQGYKISRIAKLADEEISKMVLESSGTENSKIRALNSLKVAMINFDESLFHTTYENLAENRTFSQIFHEIFIPLLDEIGILWQTNTIKPVHEHFLAGLMKEKLYYNISLLETETNLLNEKLFILFLPENEIHELGLLFLNLELKIRKRRTIFLSPGIPIRDLRYLVDIHPNPVFISYLTVAPRETISFLADFQNEICKGSYKELLLFGAKIQSLNPTHQAYNIKIFKSISEFLSGLDLNKL